MADKDSPDRACKSSRNEIVVAGRAVNPTVRLNNSLKMPNRKRSDLGPSPMRGRK